LDEAGDRQVAVLPATGETTKAGIEIALVDANGEVRFIGASPAALSAP